MTEPTRSYGVSPVEGRACGKLILFGEHAVVYDVPAVVLGIPRGLTATARRVGAGQRLDLLGARRCAVGDGQELGEAFAALLSAAPSPEAVEVVVAGTLPAGVGLGFSAAAAVAIARAIEGLGEDDGDREVRVKARADAWERVYHGNPSGVDVAAAMRGGCRRFLRSTGVASPLSLGVPLHLAVGLTGHGGSTKEMVANVASFERREPAVFARSLEGIRTLVDNAVSALEQGDTQGLGQLMDLNQMLLAGWMVSTPELEQLCAFAREAGALGAKLTGAGGGGAAVALTPDAATATGVVAAWKAQGYEGFVTAVEPAELERTEP